MARYIDAEKCPCKGCGMTYCNENCKKYYAWLEGCDYDVEAVVKGIVAVHNRTCTEEIDCKGWNCDECFEMRVRNVIQNGGRK